MIGVIGLLLQQIKYEMAQYPAYPTPPSTSEDSPLSVQMISSPSYTSDSSSSPVHQQQTQVLFLQSNYTVLSNTVPNNVQIAKNEMLISGPKPYMKIVEQPIDKFRFRYKSEMTGTHGSLNGATSDKTRRMTYPTVELCNYTGLAAMLRCSIWQVNTLENDIMPHAHRLVTKKHGKYEVDDPHDVFVDKNTKYRATFHSMGIIHTAKKNIVSELIKKKTRLKKEEVARNEKRKELNKKEEMEIKGLAEAESKSINLNVVCLRFDAFYVGANDVYFQLCPPVFSHAINNLKSALTGELKIVRMDHCTSPAHGDREIFLLVERVTKKNIKVRFYEIDDEDNLIWEDYGKFSDLDVHHQYAIVLRTPPYADRNITTQVKVFMELIRPSDNARSDSKDFTYIPSQNHVRPGVKRQRVSAYDTNDYDTTSVGNDAIPVPILNISGSLSDLNIMENEVTSEELAKAMTNIDSDEFRRIFDVYGDEYRSAGLPLNENLSVDYGTVRAEAQGPALEENCSPRQYYSLDIADITKLKRVYQEISGLLSTKPQLDRVIGCLRNYLSDPKDQLNAFHMAVMLNDRKIIRFFVRLITFSNQLNLVNVKSQKGFGTVLHLATLNKNLELVQVLVTACQADVSLTDVNFNTPLHIAAAEDWSGHFMEALLQTQNVSAFINAENKNNNTALHRAVKRKNMRGVKILFKHGADCNYRHPSNGYSPLRFAMNLRDIDMVKFLLYDAKVNASECDFNEINPIQVALSNLSSPNIKELIHQYMSDMKIPHENVVVKEEIEVESSEDEMVIFEEVKAEPLPLCIDWEKVTKFTKECLDDVSRELDASGKWEDLASLLDVDYLLSVIRDSKESPSKQLLNAVVTSNQGSIKEIRDFLDNLDQSKAVAAIERMALQIGNSDS